MAAGLGFKTFATGDVLSAADTNGYLMQGVLVFASAAARDSAITSPQEGQFAYLKDTNVTMYYTGSAWANLDTTGMTNPMTTTGDTIYSSSGSTPARLGIGSAGQVLTVASGVPSWATPSAGSSGLTLVQRSTFSNVASTGTTFDNVFSTTYKNYLVVIDDFTRAGGGGAPQLQMLYSGTTQASGYFASSSGINSSAVTLMGTLNGATSVVTLWATLGTTGGATTISLNFSIDRTGNNFAYWHGTGYDGENANQYALGGVSSVARNYTGFLLKSSVANVSGTVSIYGLAK